MSAMSPSEVLKNRKTDIPEFVFDAVNELLSENISSEGTCKLYQEEILGRVLQNCEHTYTSQFIYNNNCLDFEDEYNQNGWNVTYVKSPYYETGHSYFDFSCKD